MKTSTFCKVHLIISEWCRSSGCGSAGICWAALCVTLLGQVRGNRQALDGPGNHAAQRCICRNWQKQETESPLSSHSPSIVFLCDLPVSWGHHPCFTSSNAEAHCRPVHFTGILKCALQALSPWEAKLLPTGGGCHYHACLSSFNPFRL